MPDTPNLGLPLMVANQDQPHVIYNAAMEILDDEVPGGGGGGPVQVVFQIAASDLTTDLTTGSGKAYFRAPYAFDITEVRASLIDASSSGAVEIDINKNGVTVLSTPLTIDASEKTSTTAATPAVISVDSVADDDEISIDIVDEGTDAKGLIVTLIGVLP